MKKKLNLLLLFVLLAVELMAGCRSGTATEEENTNENSIRIAILIYRFDDEFIDSVMDEIKKEQKQLADLTNQELVVDFIDGNNQTDLQFNQIKDSLNEGYDALAVNLVDRSQAAGVIDLAKTADIPIVFFNREPIQVDMARWNKIYYVGSKGEDSGLIQGDIVAEEWFKNPAVDRNKDGILQYIMLKGQQGHQDVVLRTENSIKSMLDNGLEIEELVNETANWQRDEAKDKMLSYLDIFENEVEFIISNNDMMALGAVDAMKELGYERENYIPIVGVDAIDIAVQALERGEITGTVYNDHVKQGQMVMRMAYYLAIDENPTDYLDEIENGKYYRVEYQKVTR